MTRDYLMHVYGVDDVSWIEVGGSLVFDLHNDLRISLWDISAVILTVQSTDPFRKRVYEEYIWPEHKQMIAEYLTRVRLAWQTSKLRGGDPSRQGADHPSEG